MARFFIDRPIFAWVLAIICMLAGVLSILNLPISQYPSIAPPQIQINASYTGASADTVQNSVTQVIEQNMKGIDNLLYMSSTSDSTGAVTITLTFDITADPDIAQVQVQNKLQTALPLLPQEVQNLGVTVTKANSTFLMVLGFVSEDGKLDGTDLSDFVASNIIDPLSRVQGVGTVTLFGAQYAMRVWLDPDKLNNYKLTPADVSAAIQAQNAQVSAGQLGGTPSLPGQQFYATITAQTRLQTPQQFENIFLRNNTDGSAVRIGDVARVELGAESYDTVARYNGKAAAGVAVSLATGANALATARNVETELARLKPSFPEGVSVVMPYDTTPFVRLSIEEVVKTLGEAILLVFLVMYLFLQNFRATLIPTIAVPVVLLGTFAVLYAFGYTINTLTMFAMVLAIGLLVDDAIVVVENVERVMTEEKLSPKEATKKSMGQITGALVGIALVLAAVFVPMAFFGGSVGVIYRQFSVTIVSAMTLSVLVAIILTPALCATMLKPVKGHAHPHHKRGFFGWFNRGFARTARGYSKGVAGIIRRPLRTLLIYALLVAGMAWMFVRLPTSFLPEEDQGVVFALVIGPTGSTQEHTLDVLSEVERHFLVDEEKAVKSIFTVAGFSFAGNGQDGGIAFVMLRPWDERPGPALTAQAVAGRAMMAFSKIRDALVFSFTPPAVIELGNASGFDFYLQDRSGHGHAALMEARNMLLGMAAQNPLLVGVRPNGKEDTPQFRIDIDQAKAGALGISLGDINNVLSTAWGGSYVNDFIDRGRVKKVYMQGDAPFRMLPEQLNQWYVRNSAGDMVPFSAFAKTEWGYGSPRLERYNGISAVNLQGQPAPGVSSGAAMAAIEQLVTQLPPGFDIEWTGLSYQERASGDQAPLLYTLSILIVFLCLAALYESWSIPFSVILVVPLGVAGAVLAAWWFGLSRDVYFQVGLLTTIGLSAKNAILIVEFAKELQERGKPLAAATIEAARLRLRPIIMTSLAFILGVVPLATSTGAGSGSQNAIGIGVMGGMIAATILAPLFVPLFFVVVRSLFRRDTAAPAASPATDIEVS